MMVCRRLTLRFGGLALALLTLPGCFGEPAALVPPPLDPSAAGQLAMQQYDTNQDGAVAGDELNKAPGLKGSTYSIDKDNDGRITAAEVTTRLEEYIKHRVALRTMPCEVRLDGQPLVGATVSLVPEKFMGEGVKPAQGTTDESGFCILRIEGEEIDGVHCGVFQIEVSKKDAAGKELVPAKFNTSTTLGVDTGLQGAPEGGMVLDLKR